MKYTYEFIKENLRIYDEAKSKLSIVTDFENDRVSLSAMRSIGLGGFAEFWQLKKADNLIKALTWKELKPILIDSTKNPRFKTWLKNRTEKRFCEMLNNEEDFDRLLNGRWVTKPDYRRRGRRATAHIEGFHTSFISLLNYIISNDIEVCDLAKQPVLFNKLKFYQNIQLDIESIPQREVDITTDMMRSTIDSITSKGVDFRKLNIDFLVDTISQNLRNLMQVPQGTRLKSIVDYERNGIKYLTNGEYYTVDQSLISSGFVKVWIIDDTGFRSYYEYKYFEDMQIHRDLLLKQMGL
jgi:hypothetical protein